MPVNWHFTSIYETNLKSGNILTLNSALVYSAKYVGKFYFSYGHLKSFLRSEEKIVVVTGEPYFLNSWIYWFIAKLKSQRLVFWGHGPIRSANIFKTVIGKIYYNLPKKIMVYNRRAKRTLIEQGILGEDVFVIYNSLNYKAHLSLYHSAVKSQPTNIREYFKKEVKPLVFIGRILSNKRIDMAVLALSKLVMIDEGYVLVLIGDGADRPRIKNLISLHELEANVWWVGESYDEKYISEILYESVACLSPGNVGLTAVHSLSFGTPVVTHSNANNQMPEFEAIEHKINGMLFEEGDVTDMVSKILDIESLNFCKERTRSVIDIDYNYLAQIEVIKSLINNCA